MTPLEESKTGPASKRKASREHRRQQLIEATIETIAQLGLARITLSAVAATAKLSHGLVNFHFDTKEKLLTETLLYLAEEYRQNWTQALAAAPADPASQLDALLRADFNEAICAPSRLVTWCAFWGEAQSRPNYQQTCGANDLAYIRVMEGICAKLIAESGQRANAERVARVMRVTIEGVWLDLLILTKPYPLSEAQSTVYTCASVLFPKHFNEHGLLRKSR
jgi:AcrR family transcriptional regulator